MITYLITIAVAVVTCILIMSIVRVLPDIFKGAAKPDKKLFFKALALVAALILLTGILNTHRCAGCHNLSASIEYTIDGKIYCEKCYNDLAG